MNFASSSYLVGSTTTNMNSYKYFSPNIQLSKSDTLFAQHVEPTLAISPDNQLFVGWKEADTPTGPGVDVSFAKSIDGGKTWTDPVQMPTNIKPGLSKSDAWIQYWNNTLFYSYLEYNYTAQLEGVYQTQVTMAKSIDNGSNWTTAKASQNTYLADKETFIVSANGTIFLVYDDVSNLGGLVKLSKSVDYGTTFTDIATINHNASDEIVGPYPALSSNNTLFVAWSKYNPSNNYFGDVYYDYSKDGGYSFTNNIDLNPSTEYGWAYNWKATLPVIKFDSNDRLYIMWSEYTNFHWQIFLRYSDDLGLHWSNKIPVYQTTNSDQWEPDFAFDLNNNLHIAWLDEVNNQFRPYYVELNFTGLNRATISESPVIPVASAYTSGNFYRPGDYLTIRVDSNNIPHVVWTDGRSGSLNIYYSHLIISNTPPPTTSTSPSSNTNANSNLNTNTNSKSKSSPSFTAFFIFLAIPIYLGYKRSRLKK